MILNELANINPKLLSERDQTEIEAIYNALQGVDPNNNKSSGLLANLLGRAEDLPKKDDTPPTIH